MQLDISILFQKGFNLHNMSEKTTNFDTMICYNSLDVCYASDIYHRLKDTYNTNIWIDIKDLLLGEDIKKQIYSIIDNVSSIILIIGSKTGKYQGGLEIPKIISTSLEKNLRIVIITLPNFNKEIVKENGLESYLRIEYDNNDNNFLEKIYQGIVTKNSFTNMYSKSNFKNLIEKLQPVFKRLMLWFLFNIAFILSIIIYTIFFSDINTITYKNMNYLTIICKYSFILQYYLLTITLIGATVFETIFNEKNKGATILGNYGFFCSLIIIFITSILGIIFLYSILRFQTISSLLIGESINKNFKFHNAPIDSVIIYIISIICGTLMIIITSLFRRT